MRLIQSTVAHIDSGFSGELFLGQSFNSLESTTHTPEFLRDMDTMFLVTGMKWSFPWIMAVLKALPIGNVQYFLNAPERLIKVCSSCISFRIGECVVADTL